jgi:hypothetical protein
MVHGTVNASAPRVHVGEGADEQVENAPVDAAMHAATQDPAADPWRGAGKAARSGDAHHAGFPGAEAVATAHKVCDDIRAKAADAAAAEQRRMEVRNEEPSELLALFRGGDATLLEALSDPTYGPALLMKIQDALNCENRMFSLMSNIQASDHETKKAIIANCRA